MIAKAFTSYDLPAPFYALHMLVLKEPDGEDTETRFYRDHLYMVDPNAPGGKTLLKVGPQEAVPKFLKIGKS